MSFEQDTLTLLARAAARRTPPRVRALHLPPARADDALAGAWCTLELEDGTLGLGYLSQGATLDALRMRAAAVAGADALALATGFVATPQAVDSATRTLGFAAVHALSNWLYQSAGWAPQAADDSVGGLRPGPREHIGMIGLFGPLVPRLVATGARLVVIDLRRDLHGERDGALVTGDTTLLADCTQVLATGTLLLNGTFECMRAACGAARRFVLIGPSAGIVPDALFARGVTELGGAWITDPAAYLASLAQGTKPGAAARKFRLAAADYPGAAALIDRL